jgi:hypothetical protein
MRKDLEEGYIPGCRDCMQNKSFTLKLSGPLHPLPVLDERCSSIAMVFFNNWFCENGLPDDIISDKDKLFLSRFWRHLITSSYILHNVLPTVAV